uniref:Uncharacterized protein n=1 Tax=Timema shepardi TaxID=629360 RepID=A0A7R9B0X7_TIMSH|nr:unnamed protein product [Timema shepardi]
MGFSQENNLSRKFGTQINELWDNFGSDFTYPGNQPPYIEEYFEEQENSGVPTGSNTPPSKIHCLPLPGPFLPCQDLFDWWTLRCGVWIIFLLAMLGNGTVVFVLIFSRSKIDVPRFLVCNLAAADFFMGVYLETGQLIVSDQLPVMYRVALVSSVDEGPKFDLTDMCYFQLA